MDLTKMHKLDTKSSVLDQRISMIGTYRTISPHLPRLRPPRRLVVVTVPTVPSPHPPRRRHLRRGVDDAVPSPCPPRCRRPRTYRAIPSILPVFALLVISSSSPYPPCHLPSSPLSSSRYPPWHLPVLPVHRDATSSSSTSSSESSSWSRCRRRRAVFPSSSSWYLPFRLPSSQPRPPCLSVTRRRRRGVDASSASWSRYRAVADAISAMVSARSGGKPRKDLPTGQSRWRSGEGQSESESVVTKARGGWVSHKSHR